MEKTGSEPTPATPDSPTRGSSAAEHGAQKEATPKVHFAFTYPSSVGNVQVAVRAWRTQEGGTALHILSMEFCDRPGGEALSDGERNRIRQAAQERAEAHLCAAEAEQERRLEEARENERCRGDYDADDEVPPDHRGGDNDGFPLREE